MCHIDSGSYCNSTSYRILLIFLPRNNLNHSSFPILLSHHSFMTFFLFIFPPISLLFRVLTMFLFVIPFNSACLIHTFACYLLRVIHFQKLNLL